MAFSRALGILVGIVCYMLISLFLYKPPTISIPEVIPYTTFSYTPQNLPEPAKPKPIQTPKRDVNSSLEAKFKLPKGILAAVHQKETSGRCKVESKAGAKGCFQFMDITTLDIKQRFNYSFNPYNYSESAKAAALKLNYLYKRFKKNQNLDDKVLWALSLAAYNAGYGTVTKLGWTKNISTPEDLVNRITYKETSEYVKTITSQIFKG